MIRFILHTPVDANNSQGSAYRKDTAEVEIPSDKATDMAKLVSAVRAVLAGKVEKVPA
jgi:hypothetical protein